MYPYTGPCKEACPRFYYYAQRRTFGGFCYESCVENANIFKTRALCQRTLGDQSVTELKNTNGSCDEKQEKAFQNKRVDINCGNEYLAIE